MNQRPSIKVFDEWRIRQAATEKLALRSAERAFRALGKGLATVPPPMGWDFPNVNGEVHLKGAYIHGSSMFTFKVATGFYGNVDMGVPTGAGFVLLFDADTGFPRGILADNGYLTDLRTAAAGALAVSKLTHNKPLQVAMLGAGVQGQLQLKLISQLRSISTLSVWSRSWSRTKRWADLLGEAGVENVTPQDDPELAIASADLIVTCTPAREPIVGQGAVKKGATVIAVGSDGPEKQELAAQVVAEADKVVTDLTSQCAELGELHHAIAAGLMNEDCVHAELGEIVLEEKPGREGDETIVCDLTGVGAQDATIGEMVFAEITGQDAREGTH